MTEEQNIKRKTNWDEKYSKGTIKKTFIEIILYFIFLLMITLIIHGTTNSMSFYMTKMLTDVIIEKGFSTPSEFELTFNTLTIVEEIWTFNEQILLNVIHGSEESPGEETADETKNNSIPETSDEDYLILNENKLMGSIRLRQLRVRNNTCQIHSQFERYFKDCYDKFSGSNEDKSPFGLKTGTPWTYTSASDMDGGSIWGKLKVYPSGGYYQDLTQSRTENQLILNNLKTNLWINRGTRILFIEFFLYNANINLFIIFKLIIELPPTGGIITSHLIYPLKLIKFLNTFDYFIFVIEILYIIQVIYYTIIEIKEFFYDKINYFKSFWNFIDISVIILSYMVLCLNIYLYVIINAKFIDFNINKFINYDRIMYTKLLINNLLSILIFLIWLTILKYININKTILKFALTIKKCSNDLIGFGIMFIIIFISFAQFGYLLFGNDNFDFRTFIDSLLTLFRTILGDFDYIAIENSNRIIGPIYFIIFIFLVFFILLNMFLAIINDTYSEVKAKIKPDDINVITYIKENIYNFCCFFCIRKGNNKNKDEKKSPKNNINDDNDDDDSDKDSEEGNVQMEIINKQQNDMIEMNERIRNLEIIIDNLLYRMDGLINNLDNLRGKSNVVRLNEKNDY